MVEWFSCCAFRRQDPECSTLTNFDALEKGWFIRVVDDSWCSNTAIDVVGARNILIGVCGACTASCGPYSEW